MTQNILKKISVFKLVLCAAIPENLGVIILFRGPDCSDIDECAIGTHDCTADQICSNLDGSYDCNCLDGFQRLGNKCIGEQPLNRKFLTFACDIR